MSYLYIGIAVILLAFEFACSKKYQSLEGNGMVAGLRFNMLTGILSAIFMLFILGFRVQWSPVSLLLAVIQSICCVCYSILGFRVLKLGGMALYSTFLMSGGMLLPYFVGVLAWNEQLSVLRILGVLLILGAVIFSNFTKQKANLKLLALCCTVFVLNGFVSIVSKYHQIVPYQTVDSSTFVLYTGVTKAVLCFLALLFCKGRSGQFMQEKLSYGIIISAALVCGTSYLLQLIGAKDLPATVLYPMITGGCMIASAVAGRVFFKEAISKRQVICIGLCFVGTLLFL